MQLRMAPESMAGQEMSQVQNLLLGTPESCGEKMNVTKQQLEGLYVGKGLTIRQCADALGLPTSGGISWRLKKFGIQARPQLQKDKWHGKARDTHKKVIPCTQCGKPLERFPSLIRENNFCNLACKGEWQKQDLSGKKFGLLRVIKQGVVDKWNHVQWQCVCECGGEKAVTTSALLGGTVKSCGCQRHPKGEAHPKWTGKINIPCANPKCNKTKPMYESRKETYKMFYCSQKCHGEHVTALGSRKGENSSRYVERVNVPCAYCGKEIEMTLNKRNLYQRFFCKGTDCMAKWKQENVRGEANPNWKSGISYEPYPAIFADKRFKSGIRERDNFMCQNPECPGTDSILTIHHIDYQKHNCGPENLITLCRTCNSRANANRDFWQAGYSEIIRLKYEADQLQTLTV